jgi:hypothetical protein
MREVEYMPLIVTLDSASTTGTEPTGRALLARRDTIVRALLIGYNGGALFAT